MSATMNISGGHMNPAVTLGIWIAGKIDALTALAYVVAQLVGQYVETASTQCLREASGRGETTQEKWERWAAPR